MHEPLILIMIKNNNYYLIFIIYIEPIIIKGKNYNL